MLTERFASILKIFAEEAGVQGDVPELPPLPDLTDTLARVMLPTRSLFLGIAADGLPVAVNLLQPQAGPLAVITQHGWDAQSLLRMAATALTRTQSEAQTQLMIFTENPQPWQVVAHMPHTLGVFSPRDPYLRDLFFDQMLWAQRAPVGQNRLLIMDDFTALGGGDPHLWDSLRWILADGPHHHLWTLAGIPAHAVPALEGWMRLFRVRIYGHVQDPQAIAALTSKPDAPFASLLPGAQYCLRQHGEWFKFFAPVVGDV